MRAIMKHKTLLIIAAVIVIAAIGFTAGMLAKTSIADNSKDIGIAAAKEIALASVGVSADKATFIKESMDDSVYEIDFYTETNDYDFEIDKMTGAITEREVSPRDLSLSGSVQEPSGTSETVPPEQEAQSEETASPTVPATEPESGPAAVPATEPAAQNNNDDSVIGVTAAKEIALNHAGLSSASFQEASLDYDDGVRVYDLEFISGNKTYDYEINAYSGSVIAYDVDVMEYDDYYDD